MVKLQEGTNNQKLVTVPLELCKAMGWEKGEELQWSVEDSSTLLLEETK